MSGAVLVGTWVAVGTLCLVGAAPWETMPRALLLGGGLALAWTASWWSSHWLERRMRDAWVGEAGTGGEPSRRPRVRQPSALETLGRKTDEGPGLAHELRTPLNALRGFSALLLSGVDGPLPPDVREQVEAMDAAACRLEGLVEEVVGLVEGKAEEIPVRCAPVDVMRVLRRVVREAAPLVPSGVTLRLEPGEPSLMARADADRLLQVLVNLTVNALQVTEKGQVDLAARRRRGEVEIVVRDRGPGLGDLRWAFRPFTRGSRSTGDGLGLAIVDHLVRRQGGRLRVVRRQGGGSEWRVLLAEARKEGR